MNFFGFHFCHEEFFAMMASLPFVGLFFAWLKGKYHKVFGKKPECDEVDKHYHHQYDCQDKKRFINGVDTYSVKVKDNEEN